MLSELTDVLKSWRVRGLEALVHSEIHSINELVLYTGLFFNTFFVGLLVRLGDIR